MRWSPELSFESHPLFGLAVLVGATVSTATAMLLAVDRKQVRAGLFGFNAVLAAIALGGVFFVLMRRRSLMRCLPRSPRRSCSRRRRRHWSRSGCRR